jgi:hypothetical protein
VGAFGHVDARLARFPATRQFFCQKLASGRFVDRAQAPVGCDTPDAVTVTPPPDQDAPAYERWQCWTAAGNAVVEQACSDAPAQGFAVEPRGSGGAFRDVRLVAADGRCVGVAEGAPADAPLRWSACEDSPLQTFRL